MNLQQLKYIVALNRFRNFARAAEACQISQPTLSAMLVKLEEELDTRIFERNNKTVSPTASGKKIIRQAETALQEIDRISEIVMEDKGEIGGKLSLAVGPTIAPYILPKFLSDGNRHSQQLTNHCTLYPAQVHQILSGELSIGRSQHP
mgnify:CR=1 FL=1